MFIQQSTKFIQQMEAEVERLQSAPWWGTGYGPERPSNASVTIDDNRFYAISAHVGMEVQHDGIGMPMMGTMRSSIAQSTSRHHQHALGDICQVRSV